MQAFSYSVSRDLRTPLASIGGLAGALVEDYGAQLPPEGQRYLGLIRENAAAMKALIQGLLAFSRLSRQPFGKQAVAMGDLARQALQTLERERQGRQVGIVIGDLPSAQADPFLLRQVWVNLLSNALKSTRSRSAARIEVGATPADGRVAYYVRDNGVGFDKERAHRLFEVFQRFHGEDEFEGHGLGLALAERIVRRHGGRVWAEAQVDKGATFYFTLG